MNNTAIPFIGRQVELADLQRLKRKNVASCVIIKGRRRIGKSRLVLEIQDFFLKSLTLKTCYRL